MKIFRCKQCGIFFVENEAPLKCKHCNSGHIILVEDEEVDFSCDL